jgi:hypothetical protein
MKAAADVEKNGAPPSDELLAVKRDAIAYVYRRHGSGWIVSMKAYKEAVKDATVAFETSKKTIENWLEYDLFYGGHSYANMTHHWLKGEWEYAPPRPANRCRAH